MAAVIVNGAADDRCASKFFPPRGRRPRGAGHRGPHAGARVKERQVAVIDGAAAIAVAAIEQELLA